MSAIFLDHNLGLLRGHVVFKMDQRPRFERLTTFSPQIPVLFSTCRKHAVSPRIANICDMSIPNHVDDPNDE